MYRVFSVCLWVSTPVYSPVKKGGCSPKNEVLSSFAHIYVVPNLQNFSVFFGTQKHEVFLVQSDRVSWVQCCFILDSLSLYRQNSRNILQNYVLCLTEERKKSCGFGSTCGWINDDKMFIFGELSLYNKEINVWRWTVCPPNYNIAFSYCK